MKTSILICSCDLYKECWEPIIFSFHKYWKECEYPIYIVSNFESKNINNVIFLKVGEHKGWGTDTKNALSMFNSDYIIYFQEDYFLNKTVNNYFIKNHINHCIKNRVDYLKIAYDAMQRDKYRIGKSDYCKNPIDVRYSINTAVAIWKKDVFEKVCIKGFTGWDFERKIIPYLKKQRININSEILYSKILHDKGIVLIDGNAIQKGKWTRSGIKFLKDNGFETLIKEREKQGPFVSYLNSIKFSNKLLRIPIWGLIRILQILKLNI